MHPQGASPERPGALPFSNEDYEEDEEAEKRKKIEVSKALEEQQRLAAQSAVQVKDLQFAGTNGSGTANKTVNNGGPKVWRNDPCPCGSGKKYKKCHGA
jgi:uncharacterized protein YecA (UPF0149 family)